MQCQFTKQFGVDMTVETLLSLHKYLQEDCQKFLQRLFKKTLERKN